MQLYFRIEAFGVVFTLSFTIGLLASQGFIVHNGLYKNKFPISIFKKKTKYYHAHMLPYPLPSINYIRKPNGNNIT